MPRARSPSGYDEADPRRDRRGGRHRRASSTPTCRSARTASTSSTSTGCSPSPGTPAPTCSTPPPGSARSSARLGLTRPRRRADHPQASPPSARWRCSCSGFGPSVAGAAAATEPHPSAPTCSSGEHLHHVLREVPGAARRRRPRHARLAPGPVRPQPARAPVRPGAPRRPRPRPHVTVRLPAGRRASPSRPSGRPAGRRTRGDGPRLGGGRARCLGVGRRRSRSPTAARLRFPPTKFLAPVGVPSYTTVTKELTWAR